MGRSVSVVVSFTVLAVCAYLLLRLGELSATGHAPNSLTINAFLFLMGLSGLLKVLSPASLRFRRMRLHL
jgi:hypothetical protein